ncbi:hypothetical protein BKA67DRAFT_355299 [Truncatella angustata]|uniref:Uncharacterized protein n=1 Tax=Truncatella angustata TaxID=152316 RepID=A0A9P8UHR1_9PEZI|nr:uncharacterized protein BKA67DRAFT_355299 [Truncatella angustata]KAH6652406.1 hypothetical protein BKA67DRAFT_355299 [Truncatella angustata]
MITGCLQQHKLGGWCIDLGKQSLSGQWQRTITREETPCVTLSSGDTPAEAAVRSVVDECAIDDDEDVNNGPIFIHPSMFQRRPLCLGVGTRTSLLSNAFAAGARSKVARPRIRFAAADVEQIGFREAGLHKNISQDTYRGLDAMKNNAAQSRYYPVEKRFVRCSVGSDDSQSWFEMVQEFQTSSF